MRQIEFATQLGWMRLLHRDGLITSIRIGFKSKEALQREKSPTGYRSSRPGAIERGWIDAFRAYAEGLPHRFDLFEVDDSWMTPFQKSVVTACRRISHGRTVTYGQLADKAGFPGAARAVGNTMSRNRFPIVIPCHRVVGGNGVGGFSATAGVELKIRLLRLEGVQDY